MAKFITVAEAAAMVQDGMTIMMGEFLGCGQAHKIVDAILASGVKDLTIIANDSPATGYGHAKLIDEHRVKKLIASHIGLNPNVATQMNDGSMEVELVPQGTLAERIRADGYGLGGVLTPTGLGTEVAEGKETITVDGKEFLLEKPLHADIAILSGYKVDTCGNVWYKGTARNFNPLMATSADIVIVEADNVVPAGEIEPENVHTPGIFVNYVVSGWR